MKLKEILAQKQSAIISFEASKSVQDATKEMYEKRIGALLLKSETGKFVGILTDRDILRFYAEELGEANKVKVSEIMTEDFFVETLDSTSDRAESVMTEKRVRHLPIVEGAQVVGIISIGDLVKAKLQETAVEAKSLRDYIST
ncbi:MAG: CBS domain-containing protein [Candidatus Parabeggiatoa sp.]|nr:CBS domain-containing protein [Candidatus Parabeggiatoa sp.]